MKCWTKEEIKQLKKKYFYYLEHKEEAEKYFKRNIQQIELKASNLGITSMKINKKCSTFLGCNIAERVLSHVFKDVQRMPYGNKGYDFVCNKGFKIDVKSSCLHSNQYNNYLFVIKHNKIADYFLLIGFDNRDDLNPRHIWLIKSTELIRNFRIMNNFERLYIRDIPNDIIKFSKYELNDKLKEMIKCCIELKE